MFPRAIGNEIANFFYLENNSFDYVKLVAIGSDETATNSEKLPVANFETINSEEINATKTDLSKDQQYIINIYRTVKTGEYALDLTVKDPVPLCNSRGLTCTVVQKKKNETSPFISIQIIIQK